MSPTQLSLKLLREHGMICQVVEKWNPFAKVRQDLFGVIDIVACGSGPILGVQCTSATNHSARRNKSLLEPRLRNWLASGGAFEVWSWKGTGKKATVRREPITLEILENFYLTAPMDPEPVV